MAPQTSANWISVVGIIVSFGVTIAAVYVAYRALKANIKVARDEWDHAQELARQERENTQQLAREERQHQVRPVLVPASDIPDFTDLPNKVAAAKALTIQNMGNGPAFNIHGALYFAPSFHSIRYSCWNYGPVEAHSKIDIVLEQGKADDIGLANNITVDGKYHLYNNTDPKYRAARLTMTYRDLFGILHVSIFDYVVPEHREYRWVQLAITSGIEKDLEDLDNERVQTWRKTKPDH